MRLHPILVWIVGGLTAMAFGAFAAASISNLIEEDPTPVVESSAPSF
jgi:hypothetical protein